MNVCHKCKEPIKEKEYVMAEGFKFDKKCFCCVDCQEFLAGKVLKKIII